jgi:hypothetical protein
MGLSSVFLFLFNTNLLDKKTWHYQYDFMFNLMDMFMYIIEKWLFNKEIPNFASETKGQRRD